jgi:hypothetical protein
MEDSLLNYKQAEYSPPLRLHSLQTQRLSGRPDIGRLFTLGALSHFEGDFLTFLE